jgi:Sulfotransferase family
MRGDPVRTRTRHWSRWRRRQLSEAWRRAAYVDVLGDEARTAWLCSWQRSGSTLLAEVLASPRDTRLIYEPANLPHGIVTGEAAAVTPLPRGPGDELAAVERSLRGRVRGTWVDQLCTCHVVRRRVVKDVRAVGLLDLVAARHPRVPIVVLVRHPLSIAISAVALGWTDPALGSPEDQLVAEVRRWTELHGVALRAPAASRALLVAYEHLVAAPDPTLDLVTSYLAEHHPTWRGLSIDRGRIAAPSSTSFRRTTPRAASEWIGTFDDVAPRVLEETLRLLDAAGLRGLYGASPEPLVDLDALASSAVVALG